jgi:hypothetical protein
MSTIADSTQRSLFADFNIGPSSITAYSRLSYTLWYALAEFVDNSTRSRDNYSTIIDPVLQEAGTPLTVEIVHNPIERSITISDNSIGMSYDRLIAGLKIAQPTEDSRGRSRYGMGMKTVSGSRSGGTQYLDVPDDEEPSLVNEKGGPNRVSRQKHYSNITAFGSVAGFSAPVSFLISLRQSAGSLFCFRLTLPLVHQ